MKKLLIVGLALFFLVMAGCAPKTVEPAPPPNAPAAAPAAPSAPQAAPVKPAWEEEWDRTLAAAKREGTVVVYSTGGSEQRTALTFHFRAKYGVPVEFLTAKGAEVSQKLFAERRAGLYFADVYIGGSTTLVTELKPAGVLDSLDSVLVLPEVTDPKAWWQGQVPFLDKDHKIVYFMARPSMPLTINTDLVKPDDIKSYRDLLNPKWKGKIVMNDPTIAGTGLKWFGMVGTKIMGMDFMRELARQEPFIIRDQRLQVDWLVRGKYAIAIATKEDPVATAQKAGAPIKEIVPSEGTYLSAGGGNIALINRAPHANTAKVFINWLLSKEGQDIFCRAINDVSARVDTPTEYLEPQKLRNPAVKYIFAEEEEFLIKQPEQAKMAKEIFGHLVK